MAAGGAPGGGGGGDGVGGGGGSAGPGAGGDATGGAPDTSCLDADSFMGCINTCGQTDNTIYPQGYCDAQGQPQCPSGFVFVSECSPQSCARLYNPCCDPVTGALGNAPCGADGLREACLANANPAPDFLCIPDNLGVTNCLDLQGTACTMEGRRCRGGRGECWCGSGTGVLIWQCTPFPPV